MALMNKKGIGIITLFFWVISFMLVWSLLIGKMLSEWGQQAIISNNLTGIEAFFYANLNFVVGIVFLIAILAISLWGTNQ